jgi:CubicO group peptidase (beta-lactamase class C family)
MRNRVLLFLAFALVFAARPGASEATKAGMDTGRLDRIAPRMKSFVDKGVVAGTVTLIQRHGQVVHLEAAGYQDLESKKPMRPDTIFEIMSMTKPVTSVGIMILVEEGKVSLWDPVEKYLPEFKGMWVIDKRVPYESGRTGDSERALRRPSRPITVYDLLTHTSGMPELPPEAMGGVNFYYNMNKTLAEAVTLYSQQPLEFDPGTKWAYSNTGMATLGRIIEAASDQPYERFLEERIFKPLGMTDSFLFPPESKRDRIASVYQFKDGKLQGYGDLIYRKGAKYPMPEGGMYSTAKDMAAFYQMMLSGGALNGQRILSKASVETMTMVHTGSLPVWGQTATGYGLGWAVSRNPNATLTLSSLGTYGHGGAFGTQGWIDPAKDLVGVFMVQRSGGGSEGVHEAFREIANAAVIQ